ncbi:MAG: GNAT family N-acetyltransferase [Bacteroidetes bacterium]|nr:GNAT family N-acetyltransferase [Bacteroidota bacterium]
MKLSNCTIEDIPLMLHFYDLAREHQQKKSTRHWNVFDTEAVKKEVESLNHWKILEEDTVACIFLAIYDDPFIWGERNAAPAVYIHRIVTHPDFRGRNYTARIVEWAKEHGKALGKKFIRMDTWGDNPGLISYYQQQGFTLLEIITPDSRGDLPSYYNFISLALLEMEIY